MMRGAARMPCAGVSVISQKAATATINVASTRMKYYNVAVKSKTATNPNCHLCPRFIFSDTRVADEQHVRVMPVAGAGVLLKKPAVVAKVVDDALL